MKFKITEQSTSNKRSQNILSEIKNFNFFLQICEFLSTGAKYAELVRSFTAKKSA